MPRPNQKKMKNITERGVAKQNRDGKLILTRRGKKVRQGLIDNRKMVNRPIFIKSTKQNPKVKLVVFVCIHGFGGSADLMRETAYKLKKHAKDGGELPVSLSLKTAGVGFPDESGKVSVEVQEKLSRADLIIYADPVVKEMAENKRQHPKKWQKEIIIGISRYGRRGSDQAFEEILNHIQKA